MLAVTLLENNVFTMITKQDCQYNLGLHCLRVWMGEGEGDESGRDILKITIIIKIFAP